MQRRSRWQLVALHPYTRCVRSPETENERAKHVVNEAQSMAAFDNINNHHVQAQLVRFTSYLETGVVLKGRDVVGLVARWRSLPRCRSERIGRRDIISRALHECKAGGCHISKERAMKHMREQLTLRMLQGT